MRLLLVCSLLLAASAASLGVAGCAGSGTSSSAGSNEGVDASVGPPTSYGAPDCESACCASPLPVEGASCATSKVGDSCPDVIWCAPTGTVGLVLDDRVLACGDAGVWSADGGSCPGPGEVNERGCPYAQPANGSACSAPDGTTCHYALDCMTHGCPDGGASAPDGGSKGSGCVEAHNVRHDDAVCSGGAWSSKALPACP